MTITALLRDVERANAALVAELKRAYPATTKVRARMQPNSKRPCDVVRVVNVIEDRPGYLRVMYEGGHTSSVHCSAIEGCA